MASTTLGRDGSWVVELMRPLHYDGREVAEIVLQPIELSHVIRWSRGEIPSTLALAAELSGLPEKLLRQLAGPDVDRFFVALVALMPEAIRNDYAQGTRPLASDDAVLPSTSPPLSDPEDPRYPKLDGIVRASKGPDPVKPLFGLTDKPKPVSEIADIPSVGEGSDDIESDMPDVMQGVNG